MSKTAPERKTTDCAVTWCVCLARPASRFCAVHASRGETFKVGVSGAVTAHCDECGGTGECTDCDGEGTHTCDHYRCGDEHECGVCDGTGDCQECVGLSDNDEPSAFEARYLAFAFDPGWVPPVLIDYPWDIA